jgi:hypothetical protein
VELIEAGVALTCQACGSWIDVLQIADDLRDGGIEAVKVEAVKRNGMTSPRSSVVTYRLAVALTATA